MSLPIGIRLGFTTPATEIAPHTPPTWETLADGGCGQASFAFGRSAKFAPHLTAPGTYMEIMVGPNRVWLGRIEDYDRNTGEVSGRGIHTDANTIPALDGGGAATRDIGTAFATAVASPWSYFLTNPYGYGGVASGDADTPLMLAELISLVAQEQNKRWGQTPDGAFYLTADPTTPTWTIVPDAAAFGATSEGQVTHLVGRYFDGVNDVTTIRSNGSTEARAEFVDLTERRTLSLAEANGILDAALAGTRSQTGWVNGVTLHREQITRNGTPAFLPSITARSTMVRVAIPTSTGSFQAPWLDAVVGKTRYTAGEDTIYLEPVNTAPRNLRDVIAAA